MNRASMVLAYAGLLVGAMASVTDLVRRSIPNWLTVAGVAAGLVLRTYIGGWRGLGLASAGAALGFALLLPLQLKGAMGGGDVKLMAAFGAMLGPAGILLAALFGAILGGLWAALWILCRPRAAAVPYAPAIVLGACLSFLGGGL